MRLPLPDTHPETAMLNKIKYTQGKRAGHESGKSGKSLKIIAFVNNLKQAKQAGVSVICNLQPARLYYISVIWCREPDIWPATL